MKRYKINLKLVRSFSLGFTIYSLKLNGFCVDIQIANFTLNFWGKGEGFFKFSNYWNG